MRSQNVAACRFKTLFLGFVCEFFKETFGHVAAIYAGLADKPQDTAALDRAFLDFAERFNQGRAGDSAEYVYEYLLVVAKK